MKKTTARKKTRSASPAKKSSRKSLVLAYDLGGTKVAVGVVDSSGKILASRREPVLIRHGKKATLDQLINLGREYIEQFPRIRAIGIASAGPLDPRKGVLLDPTNFAGPGGTWGKVPIAQILSKSLRRPAVLENDAAAAILAERWKGHARGYANAMILTLGTGLGTGAICNDELVRSGRFQHPEGGHVIVNVNDASAPCGCGNYGCAEAYLSGRNFTHRARKRLGNEQIDAVQVAARARSGEKAALELFEEYSEILATLLHNFAVIYSPEIVVFTGSFAAASDLFLENTRKKLGKLLERRNQVMNLSPRLEISKLENQAGLLGGAFVALQSLATR